MKKLILLLLLMPFIFASCSSDEDEDSEKSLEIKINVGEIYPLPKGDYSIITEPNLFAAIINEDGEIKGVHKGTTMAVVRSGRTTYNCRIIIEANTTLYVDCAKYIGLKKSDIIKIYGNPININKQTHFFKSIGLEKQVFFVFDNNDIVTWAGVDFETSYAYEVGKHLADRYTLANSNNGKIMYSDSYDTKDQNRLIITVENNTSVIRISYVRYNTIL